MKKTLMSIMLLCTLGMNAKVKLLPIFSDNMVLQQQTDAPLWGEATPGKAVTVTTSWDGKSYTTNAGDDGKWMLRVPTPKAGGPYSIAISDGKPVTLNGVMIGEVWLCSGQSNMEMPMQGWNRPMNADEIADADQNTTLRLLYIKQNLSYAERTTLPEQTTTWTKCTPETLRNFSATAFFFGRDIADTQHVPVGLIMTCWGGTPVESWISGESLAQMPEFRDRIIGLENAAGNKAEAQAKFFKATDNAAVKAGQTDGSMHADGTALWAQPSFDDSAWQLMSQPGVIEEHGHEGFDGIVWYRKTIDIPASWKGRQLTLSLSAMDDHDATYFNGHLIGHTEGYGAARNYTIPAALVKGGKAVITVRLLDTGGNGGLSGSADDMKLTAKGKKGSLSMAGEWRIKCGAELAKLGNIPPFESYNQFSPTVLYNAMIRPLVPYAVKGAIWYQGEANADRAYQYRELMPLIIADWRKQWKQPIPFFMVQLANYMKRNTEPVESTWAELREAQLKSLCMEQTGMAVAVDIGLADDIHPTNKQDVGHRLALAARHTAYGEQIAYSGPIYKGCTIEKGQIRIHFNCTEGGLKAKGSKLTGFTIAGVDRKFHWADARIEGNTVVVSCPDVEFPVAVRYAWADNPECNLYNGAELPASPFRTDEWPGLTLGAK